MIVREPPYDMVGLFADLDMQNFFEALIERGQDHRRGCSRPIRWRSLRDPRRDTVWREPERVLGPFLDQQTRFLVVWDHQGSGAEKRDPEKVEARVEDRLKEQGVPAANVMALALVPELETLFRPVWDRIKKLVCRERGMLPPDDALILERAKRYDPGLSFPADPQQALDEQPKEMFGALVAIARLRRAAPLYRRIGERVSLRRLKNHAAAARLARHIASWFPRQPART